MGKVKQHEQNTTAKGAGHYLSYDSNAELYDAYRNLVDASNRGEGDKCASDFVDVWQPLENKTVDEILDYIEGSKTTYEDDDNPIKKIDFTELRNQKRLLLETINNDAIGLDHTIALEGILHLIDSLQDYAVDHLGWQDVMVYDFDDEENRED